MPEPSTAAELAGVVRPHPQLEAVGEIPMVTDHDRAVVRRKLTAWGQSDLIEMVLGELYCDNMRCRVNTFEHGEDGLCPGVGCAWPGGVLR